MSTERSIQHKATPAAPAGYGWENDGLVPVTLPEIYDEPTDQDRLRIDAAVIIDFMLLAMNRDALCDRAVLTAYVLKTPRAPKNLRQLGDRLQCSHTAARTRLSRFCADLREELKEIHT